MATVYLYWSPSCRFCGPAREIMHSVKASRDDFELIELTGESPGAQEFAKKHSIQSTPTFIIEGEGHPEYIGLRGAQSAEVLNKYIDVALGKRKLEEKKGGFLSWLGL